MFGINEGLDQVIIRPVSSGYEALLPSPIQTGVANFFSNIADLMIGVNNLLQGKPAQAASDAGRVIVNTTVGFLGILDVASTMGMEKHEEDVGQTFGRWGMDDGAYIVLPFFGPRTVRDTIGLVFDVYTDPVAHVDHPDPQYAARHPHHQRPGRTAEGRQGDRGSRAGQIQLCPRCLPAAPPEPDS